MYLFLTETMNCDSTQPQNVVFEASTQTPTNEESDSPVFAQKGQLHKSVNHCETALTNIYKMRQNRQVICSLNIHICVSIFSYFDTFKRYYFVFLEFIDYISIVTVDILEYCPLYNVK